MSPNNLPRTYATNPYFTRNALATLPLPGQHLLFYRVRDALWLRACVPMPLDQVRSLAAECGITADDALAVLTPANGFQLTYREDDGGAVVECGHLKARFESKVNGTAYWSRPYPLAKVGGEDRLGATQ